MNAKKPQLLSTALITGLLVGSMAHAAATDADTDAAKADRIISVGPGLTEKIFMTYIPFPIHKKH